MVLTPISAEPLSTAGPVITVTVTPTEVPLAGEPMVDLDTLLVPICRNDPFAGSAVGFGTVPRAPESIETFRSDSGDPLPETILGLAPVIRWVDHFTLKADTAWAHADSELDFASVIFDESRRVWLACTAISLAVPVIETTDPPLLAYAKGLMSDRQVWLTDRLEVLRTDPSSIRNADATRQEMSIGLRSLIAGLDELAREAGIEDGLTRLPFTALNPLLGISLDMPAGWMLLRNRVDIVLLAPPDLQADGVTALGVPGWNFGTALQVKRLRHEAPWTLTNTTDLMDSLLVKFGERSGEERREVDGLETAVRVYESPEDAWVTIAGATVRDLHTYLFELGCPEEDRASCEVLFQELLDGVHFDEG